MPPSGKMHPDARPWCVGDGERAFRWSGGEADDFRSIVCPNDRCEYRRREAGKMPACRPWMRLLFRLRWPDGNPLPTPLTKYTSMGWDTIRGALGMFVALEEAMGQLGARVPLYGYPITLTLILRRKPSLNRRYPVVIIAGETDPVSWVGMQRERLQAIQAPQGGCSDTRPAGICARLQAGDAGACDDAGDEG